MGKDFFSSAGDGTQGLTREFTGPHPQLEVAPLILVFMGEAVYHCGNTRNRKLPTS
jgi:hypothetical protein